MNFGDRNNPIYIRSTKDDDDAGAAIIALGLMVGVVGTVVFAVVSAPFCLAGAVLAEPGKKRTDTCGAYVMKTWDNIYIAGSAASHHISKNVQSFLEDVNNVR